jgi:hypothetical protein
MASIHTLRPASSKLQHSGILIQEGLGGQVLMWMVSTNPISPISSVAGDLLRAGER